MKFVLDSCVAVKWVIPEDHTEDAQRFREAITDDTNAILAPDVFPAEVGHALVKAERRSRSQRGTARVLWADVMLDCPGLYASAELMPMALELAERFRAGVYDCLYVALAEREGCQLVTADESLIEKFRFQATLFHIRDVLLDGHL
jgi:predicted nucleic acid-binding protein